MLTKIPHFKDIVVMAFECPSCGYHNNEIQSANAMADFGLRSICTISNEKDLNRQIVKSEYASLTVPEIEFEIPSNTQRALLNTVEGFLSKAKEDLEAEQPLRKYQDEALYNAIQRVIQKIDSMLSLEKSFTVILDDPSGNSYIENLYAPDPDPKIKTERYGRTVEQLESMGYATEKCDANEEEQEVDEVYEFPANCSVCNSPGVTRMHMLDIPYFKEVIIMATTCDYCGYKSNEVKSGGAISEKGKKITLKIVDDEDLSRDILKSETCGLEIPEIELTLNSGTLGGRFTTIEGLLDQIKEELEQKNPFATGDSSDKERSRVFQRLIDNIGKIISGDLKCSIILDDPLGNSYLQNLYAPDPDPNMSIELYERTFEQNEDFGINDMKVD
jgi:zinc finger protein